MQQLTIQMVTWNSATALRKSLPLWRRIDPAIAVTRVIDNASQDKSTQLVRAYLPQTDLVRLLQNTGFAGGHNEGFRRCTTPYVLVINPDVELNWQGILAALKYFDDPTIGALQGKLYRQGKTIDSVGIFLTLALNGGERGAGETDRGRYEQPVALAAATGACALYRLAALRHVAHKQGEIFDQDFLAYKEDVDLGWRLRRAGWKIVYAPVTFGTHERSLRGEGRLGWRLRWSDVASRLRNPRTFYSWRNWLWMIAKNAAPAELLSHSPWVSGRLLVLFVLTLIHWPLVYVWAATLRGLPIMIAKRRMPL